MCKSEIFATIMKVVSTETEVSESLILSDCKSTDTVDARYLLVYFLSQSGLYPPSIASYIHKTNRSVNYILANFENRLKQGKIMRVYMEKIKKTLGNN